jgi:hypothetical protein
MKESGRTGNKNNEDEFEDIRIGIFRYADKYN